MCVEGSGKSSIDVFILPMIRGFSWICRGLFCDSENAFDRRDSGFEMLVWVSALDVLNGKDLTDFIGLCFCSP